MLLLEIAKDTTVDEVKKATGASFQVSPNLKNF
jgi:acyl CoA:acetate/3-ketoacid CoA transferase beta subunit